MKTQVTLESKEVRKLISIALNIPEEKIIPLRYNFAIEDYTAEEIENLLKQATKKLT